MKECPIWNAFGLEKSEVTKAAAVAIEPRVSEMLENMVDEQRIVGPDSRRAVKGLESSCRRLGVPESAEYPVYRLFTRGSMDTASKQNNGKLTNSGEGDSVHRIWTP